MGGPELVGQYVNDSFLRLDEADEARQLIARWNYSQAATICCLISTTIVQLVLDDNIGCSDYCMVWR